MKLRERWQLTIILAAAAPMAFFLSNNYSFGTLTANLASMGLMALTGCVSALICTGLVWLQERSRKSPARRRSAADLIVIAAGVIAVFPFYSLHPAGKAFPGAGLAASLAVLFLLFRLLGFAVVNVFLSVSLAISLFTLGRAEVRDYWQNSLSSEQLLPPPAAFPRTFVMEHRPNIYLFFLESFHGRQTINEEYGFDVPEFFEQLARLGFTDYPSYYANYLGTVDSILALLSMRHHYNAFASGIEDTDRAGFRILADNNVFAVLKNNGYSVNLLDINLEYVFRQESKQIDFKHFPSQDDLLLSVSSLTVHINPYLQHIWNRVVPRQTPAPATVLPIFSAHFPGGFNSSPGPQFFYIHFGAQHTRDYNDFHPHGYGGTWDEEYKKEYLWGAEDLQQMLDAIEEHDPGSLIILIGDHGAWKYGRHAGLQDGDFLDGGSRINAMFREHGLEPAAVSRHLVEVLAAVRWPQNITPPDRPRHGLSHVTLFPFIFSALGGKEYDETHAERNLSFSLKSFGGKVMLLAKDGVLTEEWKPVIPEKAE